VELVNGRATFVQDMHVEGMLHARVVRPPHYHARLETLDAGTCERLQAAGLRIFRDGSFLAVAGADEYVAIKGAQRLAGAATWQGSGLDAQDIYQQLDINERVSLPVVDGTPRNASVPPLNGPPAVATVTVRARYEKPYHMHGALGPSAALAWFEDGRLTVWTHSQGIYVLRESLAEALGMAVETLRLVHMPGPGCYGHNGADDAVLDAALVARAIPATPVLLKWTREDEHAWEPYGTCQAMDLTASLDASGAVVAWSHEAFGDTYAMRPRAGPDRSGPRRLLAMRHLAEPLAAPVAQPSMGRHVGIHRNLEPLYTFPNPRLVKHLVRHLPLRTSSLRTLGAFANVFAIESFMDELAEAAGEDAVAFRRRHLADERAKAVLEAAAGHLASSPAAPGRGRGIGFAQYKNAKAYAAVGIELEVTDAAEVRLHRAVIAADAGQVVDPGGLTAQLEGGMIQAASWTLYEAVTFDSDGITSRDWESYPILPFDNVPEIETVLLDRPDAPFLGAGEATSGPTAAAIANAIKDATGVRLRRLPFTPDAIRAAALA
jgi:CO/xanthine dehydrogenase Mo-binding subunit